MQWLENTLLSYLDSWETWVAQNQSIPKEKKLYCTLPQQTLEGIRICGKAKSDMRAKEDLFYKHNIKSHVAILAIFLSVMKPSILTESRYLTVWL